MKNKMLPHICFLGTLVLTLAGSDAFAQRYISRTPAKEKPTITYDVGGSTGTYGDSSYSEINIGVNWNLNDYVTWRNAVFNRTPATGTATQGLDSSVRFNYSFSQTEDTPIGLSIFAGPGYRITKTENSGLFGDAGLNLRIGGITIGAGVRVLQYNSPSTNTNGSSRPKNDTTTYVTISGGGSIN